MQDNLQVKKGVKLAFLKYAFGAEDKICQIVLVISSKTHFTLDDRCCHNPFTLKMRAGVMTMVIEKEKEGRADDGA